MTRLKLTILILFCFLVSFGQDNKKNIWPFFCIDYTYQNTNNFTFAAGPIRHFKRHTYVGLIPGVTLIRVDNASYWRPTGFFEYAYQPKALRGALWPVTRLGFLPIKISGENDNYLYADIGLRIISVTIYAGYNLCLDNKDIKNIATYRVGLRLP